MSFKVGDEVYFRGKIYQHDPDDPNAEYEVEFANDSAWVSASEIIPAHRVTVAKARRMARMPEDYGKTAWFFDEIGEEPWEAALHGYLPDEEMPYIEGDGTKWVYAEVEE